MELPNARLEQILYRQTIVDPKVAPIIQEFFDDRWFESPTIKAGLTIALAYHKKYGQMPSSKILGLLFEKYEETHPLFSKGDLMLELSSVINDEIAEGDADFIDDSLVYYIKNKALLFSITDNFDSITQNNDVSPCFDIFQRVDALTFDCNLGLDYLDDWEEHAKYLLSPDKKTPTGWTDFDRITKGGILTEGKCLIVPIAQAGLGKSLFLSNLAVNLLEQQKSSLIITLEMSEDSYAERLDAHISGKDINALQYHIEDIRGQVVRLQGQGDATIIIKEFAPGMLSANQLSAYIQRLELIDKKPDVLIIDYISLMKANDSSGDQNMYSRVGNIAKEIRALSYKFKIPVIAPQQINGDGYDATEISMGNMAESKAINHHADFIGALYRDAGDQESNKINMSILKNRLGGQVGSIISWHIDYSGSSLRMTDWNATTMVQPLCIIDETKPVTEKILDNIGLDL